jgi:integrase/recombinase XerD
MATAKLILDKRRKDLSLIDETSNIDKNKYPLRIRIYKDKISTEITLKYKFSPNEWIESENRVDKSYPNSVRVNSAIQRRFSITTTVLSDYDGVIKDMDIESVKQLVQREIDKQITPAEGDPEIKKIISNAKSNDEAGLFLEKFGNQIIERTEKKGKFGTARWYETGINAVKSFNNDKDILISDITISFLEEFEAEHISRGNKKNGISAYLRAVRSITNYAVKEILKGKKYETYPWGRGGYSIPSERTKKRAIKRDGLDKINDLKYKEFSANWNAKNYFLFMFNNRGINFIDIAKLKKKQIVNAIYKNGKLTAGRLEYDRSKTGKDFSIKLTPASTKILNLYNIAEKSPNDFVFPIGFEETKSGLTNHQQRLKRFNSHLKEIATDAGMEGDIPGLLSANAKDIRLSLLAML